LASASTSSAAERYLSHPVATSAKELEGEVHTRHRHRPVFRLHHQHLADARAGALAVRVAKQDSVQLRVGGGDCVHGVLGRLFGSTGFQIASDAGVCRHQEQVGPLLGAQFGHGPLHHLGGRLEAIGADVLRLLPLGHGRRSDADDRHLDARHGLDDVGREGPVLAAGRDRGIRGKPGEFGVVARAIEILEAEVELVIAHRHGVVAEQVHRQHHGIVRQLRGRDGEAQWAVPVADYGLVDVFERRALNGVAAIDQQGVGFFAADLADQGGEFGKASRGGAAGEIVEGIDVAVHVGGGEHGHGGGLGRGESSGGQQEE
jgi:hypothetical protein